MNDQLPDRTVLLIILATLLLVFFLVFSFKSDKIEQEKTIQWMDSSLNTELAYPSYRKKYFNFDYTFYKI